MAANDESTQTSSLSEDISPQEEFPDSIGPFFESLKKAVHEKPKQYERIVQIL
jgi:hypothetical protein